MDNGRTAEVKFGAAGRMARVARMVLRRENILYVVMLVFGVVGLMWFGKL